MGYAISPKDAKQQRTNEIPREVYEAFNHFLKARFTTKGRIAVTQKEVVALLLKHMHIDSDVIFKNNWLDVELDYAAAGWGVEYDKPAYNESGEPIFFFWVK